MFDKSEQFPEGWFYIKNHNNGYVLMVENESQETGIPIVLSSLRTKNYASQLWRYDSEGFLVNKKSGQVMDVTKGIAKAGVDIVQQIKSTNIIREESNFQKFGLSPYGHIYLVNKPSLVLGVKETFFSRREGLHVHLQSADKRNLDRKEQRWDFVIPIVKEASQEAKKSLSVSTIQSVPSTSVSSKTSMVAQIKEEDNCSVHSDSSCHINHTNDEEPSSAFPETDFLLKSDACGLFVSLEDTGSKAPRNKLTTASLRNKDYDSQLWNYDPNTYRITNKLSGLVLSSECNTVKDGADIVQATYDADNGTQSWTLTHNGEVALKDDQEYVLGFKESWFNSSREGARLQLQKRNKGHENQKFTVVLPVFKKSESTVATSETTAAQAEDYGRFPDGYFFVKSQAHGLVLTVLETGLLAAEVVVTQLDTSNYSGQLWKYEEGYLINKSSELVLDVRGGTLKCGASICQYTKKRHNNANQQWALSIDGVIFIRANKDLVLSVNEKVALRSKLHLAARQPGNKGQHWSFILPVYKKQQTSTITQKSKFRYATYPDGWFFIRSFIPGSTSELPLVLTASQHERCSTVVLRLLDRQNWQTQLWTYYSGKLTNYATDLQIDVTSPTIDAQLVQNISSTQKWRLTTDGYFFYGDADSDLVISAVANKDNQPHSIKLAKHSFDQDSLRWGLLNPVFRYSFGVQVLSYWSIIHLKEWQRVMKTESTKPLASQSPIAEVPQVEFYISGTDGYALSPKTLEAGSVLMMKKLDMNNHELFKWSFKDGYLIHCATSLVMSVINESFNESASLHLAVKTVYFNTCQLWTLRTDGSIISQKDDKYGLTLVQVEGNWSVQISMLDYYSWQLLYGKYENCYSQKEKREVSYLISFHRIVLTMLINTKHSYDNNERNLVSYSYGVFPKGWIFIRSKCDENLFITVSDTKKGAKLILTKLDHKLFRRQLWNYRNDGCLVNFETEYVIDVAGGKLFPSASIIQWHAKVLRSSRKNQMWGLSVDGHIHPQSCSSLVLSIDDSIVLKEGAELKLAKRGAIILDYQQWTFAVPIFKKCTYLTCEAQLAHKEKLIFEKIGSTCSIGVSTGDHYVHVKKRIIIRRWGVYPEGKFFIRCNEGNAHLVLTVERMKAFTKYRVVIRTLNFSSYKTQLWYYQDGHLINEDTGLALDAQEFDDSVIENEQAQIHVKEKSANEGQYWELGANGEIHLRSNQTLAIGVSQASEASVDGVNVGLRRIRVVRSTVGDKEYINLESEQWLQWHFSKPIFGRVVVTTGTSHTSATSITHNDSTLFEIENQTVSIKEESEEMDEEEAFEGDDLIEQVEHFDAENSELIVQSPTQSSDSQAVTRPSTAVTVAISASADATNAIVKSDVHTYDIHVEKINNLKEEKQSSKGSFEEQHIHSTTSVEQQTSESSTEIDRIIIADSNTIVETTEPNSDTETASQKSTATSTHDDFSMLETSKDKLLNEKQSTTSKSAITAIGAAVIGTLGVTIGTIVEKTSNAKQITQGNSIEITEQPDLIEADIDNTKPVSGTNVAAVVSNTTNELVTTDSRQTTIITTTEIETTQMVKYEESSEIEFKKSRVTVGNSYEGSSSTFETITEQTLSASDQTHLEGHMISVNGLKNEMTSTETAMNLEEATAHAEEKHNSNSVEITVEARKETSYTVVSQLEKDITSTSTETNEGNAMTVNQSHSTAGTFGGDNEITNVENAVYESTTVSTEVDASIIEVETSLSGEFQNTLFACANVTDKHEGEYSDTAIDTVIKQSQNITAIDNSISHTVKEGIDVNYAEAKNEVQIDFNEEFNTVLECTTADENTISIKVDAEEQQSYKSTISVIENGETIKSNEIAIDNSNSQKHGAEIIKSQADDKTIIMEEPCRGDNYHHVSSNTQQAEYNSSDMSMAHTTTAVIVDTSDITATDQIIVEGTKTETITSTTEKTTSDSVTPETVFEETIACKKSSAENIEAHTVTVITSEEFIASVQTDTAIRNTEKSSISEEITHAVEADVMPTVEIGGGVSTEFHEYSTEVIEAISDVHENVGSSNNNEALEVEQHSDLFSTQTDSGSDIGASTDNVVILNNQELTVGEAKQQTEGSIALSKISESEMMTQETDIAEKDKILKAVPEENKTSYVEYSDNTTEADHKSEIVEEDTAVETIERDAKDISVDGFDVCCDNTKIFVGAKANVIACEQDNRQNTIICEESNIMTESTTIESSSEIADEKVITVTITEGDTEQTTTGEHHVGESFSDIVIEAPKFANEINEEQSEDIQVHIETAGCETVEQNETEMIRHDKSESINDNIVSKSTSSISLVIEKKEEWPDNSNPMKIKKKHSDACITAEEITTKDNVTFITIMSEENTTTSAVNVIDKQTLTADITLDTTNKEEAMECQRTTPLLDKINKQAEADGVSVIEVDVVAEHDGATTVLEAKHLHADDGQEEYNISVVQETESNETNTTEVEDSYELFRAIVTAEDCFQESEMNNASKDAICDQQDESCASVKENNLSSSEIVTQVETSDNEAIFEVVASSQERVTGIITVNEQLNTTKEPTDIIEAYIDNTVIKSHIDVSIDTKESENLQAETANSNESSSASQVIENTQIITVDECSSITNTTTEVLSTSEKITERIITEEKLEEEGSLNSEKQNRKTSATVITDYTKESSKHTIMDDSVSNILEYKFGVIVGDEISNVQYDVLNEMVTEVVNDIKDEQQQQEKKNKLSDISQAVVLTEKHEQVLANITKHFESVTESVCNWFIKFVEKVIVLVESKECGVAELTTFSKQEETKLQSMIEEYCRDLNELYSKIALDDIAADWNSYYHTLRKITEEQISSLKILIDKLYEEDVGSVTQHIDCSLIKGQFQKTVFNQLAEAKAQFADKFKMTAISEVEANKFSSNADLINDDPGFTRTQEAVEPITIYNSVQEAQNVFKSRATNTIVIFQEKIAIWYDTLFNNIQKVQLVATDCIELKKKVEAIVSQALEEISIIMEDTKLTFKQQSVVSENNSTEIVNSTQKAQKQVITLLENVHEVINEQITTLVKFAINEDLNSTEENFVILQEQAKHKTQAALENIVSAGVSVGFEGKTIELVKTAIIPESFKNVKYIAFDIMGTIVNYHATIANEWSRLLFQKKTKESVYCILNQIDIHAFAIRWYGLYLEKRLQVSWSQSDISLLLATLKSLLAEYLIPPTAFSEAELQTLASAWFKLQLFADASASIKKLKQLRNMYVISISYAFSIRSMMDLARYNCFCWHAQFTADIFAACTVNNGTLPQETLISNMPMLLGIENTDEIAIVSADPVILNAAKAHGFNTVYIDHHAISNDASNIHAETVNNEQIFADIEFDGLDVFAESFETFHAVKAAPVPVSSFDSNISGSRSWFQRMVSKVTDTAEVLKHTIID